MASDPIKIPDSEGTKSREQLDDELRARTGYNLSVGPTLRKFGGPPPDESPRPRFSEIFIGKLPRDYFEDELIPVLEKYGKLWEMRILLNDKGEGRGFAFATFYEPSVAHNIMKSLNGKEIPGRQGYKFSISMSKTHSLVVVKNLPRGKTREALQKDFEEYFEGILVVNIWGVDTEVKPPRLIASLEFGSERAAVSVLHRINTGEVKPYRQSQLEAYYSIVEDDGNSHISILHVRNLPTGCTEESLAEHFSKNIGFEKARIIKSFGFLHFRDHESADRALQEHYGKMFGGNQLELAWAKTKTFSPQLPRPQRYSEDSLPPSARSRSPDLRYHGVPPPYSQPYHPGPPGRYDARPLYPPGPGNYPPVPLRGAPLLAEPYGQRGPRGYGPGQYSPRAAFVPGPRPLLGNPHESRRMDDRYPGDERYAPEPYGRPEYGPPFKRRPDPNYNEPPALGRTVYFGGPPEERNPGAPTSGPSYANTGNRGPPTHLSTDYGMTENNREYEDQSQSRYSQPSNVVSQSQVPLHQGNQGQNQPAHNPSSMEGYGNKAGKIEYGNQVATLQPPLVGSSTTALAYSAKKEVGGQLQNTPSQPYSTANNGVSGYTSYVSGAQIATGYISNGTQGATGVIKHSTGGTPGNQQAGHTTAVQYGQVRNAPVNYNYGVRQQNVKDFAADYAADGNGWEG